MTPEQFKRMRKDLCMNQAQFGEHLGLSENSISLYERGKKPIPKMIKALAFGLWFEDVAGIIPSFCAMLEANDTQIATTVALVDSRKELKTKRSINMIIDELGKA